jgi:two-component system chemotaxis response regulator CheY
MKTVLCVDDSSTVLLSLSAILTKAGYGVEKASSGEEGLSKLAGAVKPDLIITDLNMPGINGIDFIKQVRQMSTMRFVPILFLTTESQQTKRAEAKAAGATGWLVKPVNGNELLNTIKLVMR